MLELPAADPNQDAYDDLLTAIEASQGQLALLIAVCDDPQQRQQIIQQYETDLAASHQGYQLHLTAAEPSLKTAIRSLQTAQPALQPDHPAVITVLGVEQLPFLSLDGTKSAQEQFFGYLQWTREALREFKFPVVIWVTYQILSRLSRQSPDFWSWRKGVFRFTSRTRAAIPAVELTAIRDLGFNQISDETLLPLADLQALITHTERQNPDNPLLAPLYQQMGQVYAQRLDRGESADYSTEQALAIEYFQKAIALQHHLGQPLDLATSLNYLAGLYRSQVRYAEAELLLLQALNIYCTQLGEDHPDTANSLNNLATLYQSQGRYAEAEPLYLQTLDIKRTQLGEDHPYTATSLNNLAELYRVQGRYAEAEPLCLQALDIRRTQLGEDHPDTAISLNNLAGLYKSQGRYAEAESLYLQALDIRRTQLGEDHPDTAGSLNNLAGLYKSQGRYAEAESLYLQTLAIFLQKLGENHPNTQTVQGNLRYLVQQAMEAGRAAELSDDPVTQDVLAQLQAERQ